MKKLMNDVMNSPLFNDIVTGLLVAATFAIAVPADVLAQTDLSAVAGNTNTQLLNPMVKMVSYASYGVGTVAMVSGIAAAKKHSEQPANNPLGPALGKMAAGAAFLVAPGVAGMLQQTGSDTGLSGTATFAPIIGGGN